jgi:Poly A polymerase head domain/Probable RNA and SrmB- binding site of polymerase A
LSAGSTAIPPAPGGWSSIRELVEELFAGEEAWIVGGAVRDEALERPIVDVDVAVREPKQAARRYARAAGGAPFPLSERHGAWRVALVDGRTVDFTPLTGRIEDDLATRDFSINAIAERAGTRESVDPFGGYDDLAGRRLRAVGESVFRDDPLRLLRGPRLEDELPFDFRLVPETEELIRRDAALVTKPSKERILAELRRLSMDGFRRIDELGLLAPLGGSLANIGRAGAAGYPDYDLVVFFGENVLKLPVSNETRRFVRTLLQAEAPANDSPRAIHRFRRATEPWALEALAFLGAREFDEAVIRAREEEPKKPLVRGGELGLRPGPDVGRLLEEIAEERAAGTITTKEEALEYARRNAGSLRSDG